MNFVVCKLYLNKATLPHQRKKKKKRKRKRETSLRARPQTTQQDNKPRPPDSCV